jgi:hypothetical protein
MRSLLLTSFIVISIFGFNFAHAQGVPVGANGIDLTISNDNPRPEEKFTVTAKSYSIDINSATITWTIDGKVAQKGIGLVSLETKAPTLGKEKKVSATAVTTSGLSFSNSIVIGSGSVDIILENTGYVPPFFRGKTPTVYQNNVNIIAIPHLADSKGVEYDPKSLVYQWKKNSRAVEDQSGYGKQVYTHIGEIVPREATITVTVSTRDGSKRASATTIVEYGQASLSFYIDDPLYGPLWNKTVGENIYIGQEKEMSVLMVPFGFNKPTNDLGNLLLTWMINGYDRPELETNESVTLRAPEDSEGSSNIELTIKNKKDILQTASAGFSAKFSSKNSNNK